MKQLKTKTQKLWLSARIKDEATGKVTSFKKELNVKYYVDDAINEPSPKATNELRKDN